MSPGKKRVLFGPAPNLKSLHAALTRVSAALAEHRNLQARVAATTPAQFLSPTQYRQFQKLTRESKKARQRYRQLARRVLYHSGSRNLNSRPLTNREKEAIRASGAIIRNMSAARRTVRHLPLPQNLGMLIIRSAARR
jgi:hypothetical protein